jgi:hypothetical protein
MGRTPCIGVAREAMSGCFDLPSLASSFGLAQHDRGKKIGFRGHKWPLFHRCSCWRGLRVPVRQRSRSLACLPQHAKISRAGDACAPWRYGSGWQVVGISIQQSARSSLQNEVLLWTGVGTWLLTSALGEDLGRTPCIGMARDTLSGPFDFAPVTDYRNTFRQRSAQGDRLENPTNKLHKSLR